jgi:DNA-binding GntR family transcriptional regulator
VVPRSFRLTAADLGHPPAVHLRGLRDSLVDVAYVALRDGITAGSLPPGTRLRELALAKELSISTTPVREALRRLDREGLVRHSPNRGVVVAELSQREIVELFDIREILECAAVQRAATMTFRDVRAAQAIIAAAAQLAPVPERLEWNKLEIAFHRVVGEIGGNHELVELADRTHRTLQALCVQCVGEPVYGARARQLNVRQHRQILAAVKRGDGVVAEELTRVHVRTIRDAITSALKSKSTLAARGQGQSRSSHASTGQL